MAEKSKVLFVGKFTCHFTHRQTTTEPLCLFGNDAERVWIEYATTEGATEQMSVVCVYREVQLRSSFLEELQSEARREFEPVRSEWKIDLQRQRGQRFEFPSALSEGADDSISQIIDNLRHLAESQLCNLRWRLDLDGPAAAFSKAEFHWSIDGMMWTKVPQKLYGHPGIRRDISVPNLTVDILRSVLNRDRNEPIAHSLWRDAWQQRFGNLKAAIMQGVAALEVGTKECISCLVPETEYLMRELPSPPVANLLRDYLPQLSGKNSQTVPDLEAGTIKSVQNMVHQRNCVVHRGELTASYEKVVEYLQTVHDLLYYLDYLCGHEWAIGLTTIQFKQWFKSKCPDCDVSDPLTGNEIKEDDG